MIRRTEKVAKLDAYREIVGGDDIVEELCVLALNRELPKRKMDG